MHVGIPGKCPTCLKAISQVKSEGGRITSLLMLSEEVRSLLYYYHYYYYYLKDNMKGSR